MPDKFVRKIVTPFGERLIKASAVTDNVKDALKDIEIISFSTTFAEVGAILAAGKLPILVDETIEDSPYYYNFVYDNDGLEYVFGNLSGTIYREYRVSGGGWGDLSSISFEKRSNKVEVIQVVWDTDHYTYPTYSEIDAIVHTKKNSLCLLVQNPGGSKDCWWVSGRSAASVNNYYKFIGERGEELYIHQDGTNRREYPVPDTGAIAPDYDPTQAYPTVGTAVMQYGTRYVNNVAINTAEEWTPAHWTEKSVEDEIGNVEALLAAL